MQKNDIPVWDGVLKELEQATTSDLLKKKKYIYININKAIKK